MSWNKALALRHEVTFDANTDISLSIIEPLSGKEEQLVPVKLSGHATFSHYSVTPARGLHFGPVTYNTTSTPRTFEIANLGEFPFTLKLFPMGEPPPQFSPPEPASAPATMRGSKGSNSGGAAAGRKPPSASALGRGSAEGAAGSASSGGPAGNLLTLGQFSFEPAEAVLQPGGRLEVSVTFQAAGAAAYGATAGIAVSERDPADHPEGLAYEVAGESCVPGAFMDGGRSELA